MRHNRRTRLRHGKRGVAYPLALLLVLLSLGTTACAGGSTTAPPQPPRLRHDTGLACVSPPAWSPDGHFYAVLGSTSCIPLRPNATQAIFIFDGASGKLARQISLAPYFPTAPYGDCVLPPQAQFALCNQKPLWSPDGQSLAVSYLTPLTDDARFTGNPSGIDNLLIVRADGSGATHMAGRMEPLPPVAKPGKQPSNFLKYWESWDLQGKSVHFNIEAPGFSTARAIRWRPNGALVPQPTTAAESAPAPVGNPMGGASFSPWQAGQLQSTATGGGLDASFSAWSPDGRYIALGLGINLMLTTGSASAAAQTTDTTVAPRDAGLARLLKDLAAATPPASNSANVMWDAAGTRLLALSCTGLTSAEVHVLDTANGATIARMPLALDHERTGNRCQDLGLTATWDAAGRSVVISSPLGGMLLWHPKLS